MTKISAQLEDTESSANDATDLIESEQLEKREMEDQLAESMVGSGCDHGGGHKGFAVCILFQWP